VLLTPAKAPPPRKGKVIDFEFRADPGERPLVWCLAVRDVFTGEERVYWRDELLQMSRPPFDIGPDTAIIGYYASAEWGCFAQLGWQLPAQPVDLFAEVRVTFNRHLPKSLRKPGLGDRWGLYNALERYAIETGESAHKKAMREAARTATLSSWTEQTRRDVMMYCADDVRRTAELFLKMYEGIDWPQARLRGLYTEVVGACIEHTGIPLDGTLFRRLTAAWDAIKHRYIVEIEKTYGYQFHIDGHFNHGRFMDWLAGQKMPWLFTDTGAPKLDDNTFREMERRYPRLGPLRRLFSHILDMKVVSLPVGQDFRNRCLSSVFSTMTGRTMPSPALHIWGQPAWIRGLIRPPEGYVLVVLDWKGQEYAILAGRSEDQRMIHDYLTGDPYLAFAIAAGLAPPDATKTSHRKLRDQCKVVCLAIPYGGTEHAVAAQLDIPLPQARNLVQLHKAVYPDAHRWLDKAVYDALAAEVMYTKFGWKWRPEPFETSSSVDFPTARTIRNFYCQGDGGDMMRIGAVLSWRAGITVCATMHDALMILVPERDGEEAVRTATSCMQRAGRAVTGFDLTVEPTVVHCTERYMSEKPEVQATWERTMSILNEIDPVCSGAEEVCIDARDPCMSAPNPCTHAPPSSYLY